jgi:hypothetical protein
MISVVCVVLRFQEEPLILVLENFMGANFNFS